MRLIRITKRYRGGLKTHDIFFDEDVSDSEVDYAVEEWCDQESSGSSYGFAYEWTDVQDLREIHEAIEKELSGIKKRIDDLNERKMRVLRKYLEVRRSLLSDN